MLIKTDLNCNVGCVRQNNEDMVLLAGELFRDTAQMLDLEIGKDARFPAIVADGMGGHKGGEIASEYAAEFFGDFTAGLEGGLQPDDVIRRIKEWEQTAHRNILRQGTENPEYEGMGTTFCGLLFYESSVFSINAGDSRLYRFRSGILRQISADHSMRELTGDHTMASNQIYNSLGAGVETFIDVKDLTGQLFDDDIFLVCSDGLCDMVSDEEIERILTTEPTAAALVEAALSAGGKDNVSVILLEVKETEEREVSVEKKGTERDETPYGEDGTPYAGTAEEGDETGSRDENPGEGGENPGEDCETSEAGTTNENQRGENLFPPRSDNAPAPGNYPTATDNRSDRQ